MLRIKQEIKSPWLQEHVLMNKIGNLFPAWHILEVLEFDDASAGVFDEELWSAVNDNQLIVPIIVDSFGGQVYSLMRMLDTITAAKAAGAKIVTIGKGKMMSCGSVLVAAGTKGMRYVQPQASMMIHEVSSSGRGKNMELQADAEETNRLNTILLYKLAEFAGKPKKYFIELIHNVGHADMFLSAKDIVKIGLTDNIGEPILSTTIKMDVQLTNK